jgi:hypothetical protein
MGKIQLGKIGLIIAGDDAGWYVKIIDDTASTGGFYISTSEYADMKTGFDSWVCTMENLESFFVESNWEIDWSVGE